MELLQLRYFFESALNESFTETAKKYMVPPSSVSLTVKKLEDELGCQLFDRTANKIQLNHAGKKLRNSLADIFTNLDEIVAKLENTNTQEFGEISLLIKSHDVAIIERVAEYKKLNPNVTFKISHDFSAQNINDYDIIVDVESSKYNNFRRLPLSSEKVELVTNNKFWSYGRNLTLSDLHEEDYILYGKDNPINEIALRCCKRAGFNPHVILETDDESFIERALEQELGIAIVTESFLKKHNNENLSALSVYNFNYYYNTCAYIDANKLNASLAYNFFYYLTQYENRHTILWHKVKQKSAE